jgi:hypothetical protein
MIVADVFGGDPVGWVIAILVGVATLFGAVIPNIRTKRAQATIELQNAEIVAYEKAVSRFRDDLAASEKRCQVELAAMDRRHADEIGELKGRIEALTPEFARTVADLLREEGIRGN